jgi:hypothetical protein
LLADKIGYDFTPAIRATQRSSVLNSDVLALNIPGFSQTLFESIKTALDICSVRQDPDHRQRRLLGARHERPRSRRAAEKGDEFAPSHWDPLTPEDKTLRQVSG